MPNLLTVVAEFNAKPGKADELRAILLSLIEPTRAEEGCVQYDLHQDCEHPGRFLFYENWVSKEALDKHLAMPYLQALLSALPELNEGDLRVTLFQRIG